jgi:hypothetical protein
MIFVHMERNDAQLKSYFVSTNMENVQLRLYTLLLQILKMRHIMFNLILLMFQPIWKLMNNIYELMHTEAQKTGILDPRNISPNH